MTDSDTARPDDMLEAVANVMAGPDGCCMCFDDEARRCCMTERAQEVFAMIAARGGPTLEQLEALCTGELILAWPAPRVGKPPAAKSSSALPPPGHGSEQDGRQRASYEVVAI